jgi:hypothetical protein
VHASLPTPEPASLQHHLLPAMAKTATHQIRLRRHGRDHG